MSGCAGAPDEPSPPLFLVDRVPSDGIYSATRADLPRLREQAVRSTAVTIRNDTRRALTPPLPSRLSFVAELPSQPVLQFAISVATLGTPEKWSSVRFRITLDSGRDRQVIFRETVTRRQRNRWLDRAVDLTPWKETAVQLILEVDTKEDPTPRDPVFPLWGNPVVFSKDNPIERPPIILVSIDCLRPDHMGLYGYQRPTTPRLDEFSRDALVFENAIAASSWTLPSHMSMLTGLTPSFHAVSRELKLGPSVGYLPELLSKGAYEVDGVVTGAYLSPNFGFERGFHNYRVIERSRAEQTLGVARELLEQARGRDVFLFVHLFDPHWRYLPPDEFVDLFKPRPTDLDALLAKVIDRVPPSGVEDIDRMRSLYDGEIAYVDRELGIFFEWLRERDLYDRSLIIVTSDHGEAFYEHGYWQHSDTLYQEMIRVPLLVKWPGSAARSRVESPVSHVDLFSTILEAAGLPSTTNQGTSLSRYRRGSEPTDESPTISEVIWRSPSSVQKKVSIRSRNLKYIASFEADASDDLSIVSVASEELYDLASDPAEKNPLDEPRHLEAFREQLRAYLDAAREFRANRERGGPVVIDESVRKQLEALGYIQ